MVEYARNTGVQDTEKFQSCLESDKYADVVKNYDLAHSIGLNGTPKFIILKDGYEPTVIPGALPYSEFEQMLDQVA